MSKTILTLRKVHFSKIKVDGIINLGDYLMSNYSSKIVDRAGQKLIRKELKYQLINNKVEVGNIYRTSAGKLKNAKYIFHTYLPPWKGNIEKEKPLLYKHFIELFSYAERFSLSGICFEVSQYCERLGYPRNILAVIVIDILKNKLVEIK